MFTTINTCKTYMYIHACHVASPESFYKFFWGISENSHITSSIMVLGTRLTGLGQ